ncbi:beta-ketoacyl-[acyl-carrier-protein] synthase family protein [Streptomyces scabiei]|uniref:beta-ketoacyl-[acyl-carrier-protein] synthase family protein n=1 Tax=Streptomyces scabiei TaxID=1930 RepID=UPI0029AA7819|nr:beta-ketoacyl-[acyl-carrier-protein] synthase family protein [Streptomyces scabiei]MDX3198283.1 beta-ketoacyl-[acyl-carrier-protein] synthase family protein [Streptomyces scabiei]MDX3217459.1 beta-ketoacyl-[acyl-carrier-protein] synthase family protein [Streptomyces scabiei]
MTGDVTVTGFGVRTAFGAGADALRRGVFAGVPSFAPTTRFDTGPYRTPMAGAAPDGADAAEHQALRPALAHCGREALDMAGLPTGTQAAVLLGIAGDCTGITRFWREAAGPRGGAGPADPEGGADAPASNGNGDAAAQLADAVPAHLAESLAHSLGLTGPRLTFTNACVASAAAIIHACRLISSGRADVAVCAGGYLVEEETFGKFDSGRALSRDGLVRPFSADRTGLLLGDGVAAVVLESAEHARRRGARPLAGVTGWGAATDAHHIAQPHPEGVGLARAARQALRLAGDPDGAALGYVNAHGTGTRYNDGAETRGLRAALGERAESVPVSSTKGTTGHLLEAAGVVEFVITVLALMDGVLPPTANLTRPDPECDLDYVPNRPRQADLRRALTINAAFGGANTALVLERP